eukprot:5116312-Pyramimonas_sp.AAC.1
MLRGANELGVTAFMAAPAAPAGSLALLAGPLAAHAAPLPTAMRPSYARPEPAAVMPAADSQIAADS